MALKNNLTSCACIPRLQAPHHFDERHFLAHTNLVNERKQHECNRINVNWCARDPCFFRKWIALDVREITRTRDEDEICDEFAARRHVASTNR